jgi:hypothetical protein
MRNIRNCVASSAVTAASASHPYRRAPAFDMLDLDGEQRTRS